MTLETETPLDFDFTYEPGEPQTYDYPGSGPEVRITHVRMNGVELPFAAITPALYDQMIEHVLENYE